MSELTSVVYLALGSNLGERMENMRFGIQRISALSRVEAVSSLYETEPLGPPQPSYYNAVCSVSTGLRPHSLLRFLKSVEKEAGRESSGEVWGPRLLDLDILLYGEEAMETGGLTIPHPRMHERSFVLVPLAEIAPDAIHPRLKRTAIELLHTLDAGGVRLVTDTGWRR